MKESKKFTIKIEATEQQFIESCLNKICSGYNPFMELFLFALTKSWHIDKLKYYIELIRDAEESKIKK